MKVFVEVVEGEALTEEREGLWWGGRHAVGVCAGGAGTSLAVLPEPSGHGWWACPRPLPEFVPAWSCRCIRHPESQFSWADSAAPPLSGRTGRKSRWS